MKKEKILVLNARKNLKIETIDLKILLLKNIIKREYNLRIF